MAALCLKLRAPVFLPELATVNNARMSELNAVTGPSTFPGCLSDITPHPVSHPTHTSAITCSLSLPSSNTQLGQKWRRETKESEHAGSTIIEHDSDHCIERPLSNCVIPQRRRRVRESGLITDTHRHYFSFADMVNCDPFATTEVNAVAGPSTFPGCLSDETHGLSFS
jgi:hypothetical protein